MDHKNELDRDERLRNSVDDRNDADAERAGSVLGLSGSPVPKTPGDPVTEHDPEAAAQRRARLRSGEDEGVSGGSAERPAGATGIDMGAGGTGTDVTGD